MRRERSLLLPLALVGLFLARLVAAPGDVAGMLYEEFFEPMLSPNAVRLYHLRTDGTYVLLTNDIRAKDRTTPLPGKGSQLPTSGGSETGTYDYTPGSSGDSAVLRLGAESRTLYFPQSGDAGVRFPNEGVRFYRPTTSGTQRNFSNRVHITRDRPAIAGFVLDQPRWALIRVVGPSLRQFGVATPCEAPVLQLYQAGLTLNGGRVFEVRSWLSTPGPERSQLEEVFALVGAFPLLKGSADCAMLRYLEPGAYTIHATTDDPAASGEVLVEVYYLPFAG